MAECQCACHTPPCDRTSVMPSRRDEYLRILDDARRTWDEVFAANDDDHQ